METTQFSDDFIINQFEREIVNSRNRFDNTGFLESGKKAEKEFFSNFPEHILATTKQNKIEHWDGWTE